MFRVGRVCLAVSPFSIFLMDQKNNPALQGYSIGKRAKVLSKMYKDLPQKQRKELQKRAEKHPSFSHKKSKSKAKPKVKPSDFSAFVKDNYDMVKGLNYKKRFSALSQLYELQKPVELSKELRKMGVDPATVNVEALVKTATVVLPKSVSGRKAGAIKPAKKTVKKAAKEATASASKEDKAVASKAKAVKAPKKAGPKASKKKTVRIAKKATKKAAKKASPKAAKKEAEAKAE